MTVEDRATVNPNARVESDIQQYLASDGQGIDHPSGDGLILLYTTGRKTGEIRRVAVGSFPGETGGRLVIAGNGGDGRLPTWYQNLLADSRVWVRKQSDFYEADATVLSPGERDAFLRDLTARVPGMARFQAMAGPTTPVVLLAKTNK